MKQSKTIGFSEFNMEITKSKDEIDLLKIPPIRDLVNQAIIKAKQESQKEIDELKKDIGRFQKSDAFRSSMVEENINLKEEIDKLKELLIKANYRGKV